MTKLNLLKLTAFLLLAAVFAFCAVHARSWYFSSRILSVHHLGIENKGVRIYTILRPGRHVNVDQDRIWLFDGSTCFQVNKLAQLAGYVHISSPDDALMFVRIPNLPEFEWNLDDSVTQPEIMDDLILQQICEKYPQLNFTYLNPVVVLPNTIFRHLQFKPPTITQTPSGYQLDRSEAILDLDSGSQTITQIVTVQETVGRNGSYHRRILSTSRAPAVLDKYLHLHLKA